MTNYFIAIAGILLLLIGWLMTQSLSRRFAARHPEFGTYREEGQGCGDGCSCTDKCTSTKRHLHTKIVFTKLHFNKVKGDHHE